MTADFPFYDGSPLGISTGRWLIMWFGCLLAFLVLSLLIRPGPFGLIAQVSYTAIMLAFLAWGAGRRWTAIFRRVRLRDIGLMVTFAAVGMVTSTVVAVGVSAVFRSPPTRRAVDLSAGPGRHSCRGRATRHSSSAKS